MKTKYSSNPADLRRAAEARVKERTATSQPRSEADLRRLQHELEVSQIELEMQNEELRAAHTELSTALERYTDLYDFAPVGYLTLDRAGTILEANLTGAGLLGLERASLVRRRLAVLVLESNRLAFDAFLEKTFTSRTREFCELEFSREGTAPLAVRIEAVVSEDGLECRAAVMDVSERRRAEIEQDRTIEELQKALAQVKQMSGMLPICSSCKKIRDDRGYWNAVEKYVTDHSDATFTHGLCPDCKEKFIAGAKKFLQEKPKSDSGGR